MQYQEYAGLSRSKKYLLAHLEAKQKLKLFTLFSGSTYVRSVPYFVVGLRVNGALLTQGSSTTLSPGQWYFSPSEGKLYLHTPNSLDPKKHSIYVTYRFFYSNYSCDLPSDLATGETVHYDARILTVGDLKLELDYENTGIALEANSSIGLAGNDGYFDDIYDTLIWENNLARFYSWHEYLPATEAKLIYKGIISDKSFSTSEVRFQLKDELSQLRQSLEVGRFSLTDGSIEESLVDKPKRLIFGRVNKIRTTGIDKTLNGYPITGTVNGDANRNLMSGTVSGIQGSFTLTGSGTKFTVDLVVGSKILIINGANEYNFNVKSIESDTSLTLVGEITATFNSALIRNLAIENNVLTGTGTLFLSELSPGDKIFIGEEDFSVESIESDTSLTISDEITSSFTGLSVTVEPEIPYRRKNRRWHIAGHKLREYSTSITTVVNGVNIVVSDIGDIEEGDLLRISGRSYLVVRVSGNSIRLNQGLENLATGITVTKIPVMAAYSEGQKLVVDRDFSIVNTATDSYIELSPLAEFNNATIKSNSFQLQFRAGSREVTTSATDIDLSSIFKPRDWIKAKSISMPKWYEILSAETNKLTLRTPAEFDFLGTTIYKSPEYLNDSSLITVDCLGLESNNSWIRYPSEVAKWILGYAGFTDLNESSFTQAAVDCPFTMALYYPASIGSELPIIRDMLTDVNRSCFGSLFLNNSFQFTFNILNADRPEEGTETLRDDDILGFSTLSKNAIVNSVLLEYSPYVDLESKNEAFKTILLDSDFVNQAVGKKEKLVQKAYLYYERDAEIMAERWLFFRSLTQTVVSVKTKLNLSLKTLNDRIFLDLSRLFKRFGGTDRRKIGIINYISKDAEGAEIQFNDLGNIFNRVAAIAPNTALDYSLGNEELVKYGYILDNDTETPDASREDGLGTSLIG